MGNDINRKIHEAVERVIPAYYQPDGTAFKTGEILPPEDVEHFRGFLQAGISQYVGQRVVIDFNDAEESITITPVSESGERLDDLSAMCKYELGTGIDIDGDGK